MANLQPKSPLSHARPTTRSMLLQNRYNTCVGDIRNLIEHALASGQHTSRITNHDRLTDKQIQKFNNSYKPFYLRERWYGAKKSEFTFVSYIAELGGQCVEV